jgi:non-specific serine/threonine protein kinase/serine/threonine-protein kinase
VTAGRLPDAIVLLEEVLASQSAVLPADHPDTLASLNNLAMTYVQADRLGEALPLFERAFAGVEKTEFRLESAAKIANNSITAHEQAGQFGRAETWRREWLEVVKESKGEESAAYAGELVGLGLNLLKQEKWDQAEEVLRESFTLRRQHEPADWRTFNTQSLFGGSRLGQKRFAEAEEHLVAGFEGMKEREAEIPESSQFRLLEARERLVELYTAWGKPEEAARWREGG